MLGDDPACWAGWARAGRALLGAADEESPGQLAWDLSRGAGALAAAAGARRRAAREATTAAAETAAERPPHDRSDANARDESLHAWLVEGGRDLLDLRAVGEVISR